MRNRMGDVLWGLIFIVLGVGFAGNAFHIWNFDLFFAGWWTLFIIVPCAVSIIQSGAKSGNVIGLIVGILLLLSAQDVLRGVSIGELIIPVIFVVIGLNFLFRNYQNRGIKKEAKTMYANGKVTNDLVAIFSGRKVSYQGEEFWGANATAIFGGVDLDLREAVFTEDVVIQATTVFGGIGIFLPENVSVKVNSIPIFGGVTNKTGNAAGREITVYLNATSIFGGIEVK
ncbi:MAG: cell wall-active antibiotics response protein [Lachnospiraceae bacterium]|nr:cell wall-active antibiotics response protein [Lachnospiraceae bacterium]